MSESSEKIKVIIEELADQLGRCWHAYVVAKSLKDAFDNNRIPGALSFFAASYRFCLESAILAFARVVINDSDSVNIWYLLNCVENNPSGLPNLPESVVIESVADFRQRLQAMQPLFKIVKEQRDRVIAHLDKKIVNAPEIMKNQAPIIPEEFERGFDLLLSIIRVYYRALIPSIDYHLDDISPTIESDLAYLIDLMLKS